MKACKEIIENYQRLSNVWVVPSKSQPGTTHKVRLMPDGRWECDCPAIKECWHIKIVKKYGKYTR